MAALRHVMIQYGIISLKITECSSLYETVKTMKSAKYLLGNKAPASSTNNSIYWCLNRHLCDLREGFGKKDLNH